ncbi:hypothetical protein Tco_0890852 [Tanacetum coccineum]|uniref:Uncharacterized protein n=1 Tax=Tanacetum coccineum TaxID=301880 RepID=A0ABQ5C1M0_9ASTR
MYAALQGKEVLLPQVHHEFLLWEGCNRDAKSRMGCDGEIHDMLRIRLREAGSDEEIFTSYQLADIFTKALGRERIEFLINKLGMRSFTPETLKKLADDVDE